MKFRKLAAGVLTLALGACICQLAVCAAEQSAELRELPVSIRSTGETPLPAETLMVELEAIGEAPLPDVTRIPVTEGGSGAFGPIRYSGPGDYRYTVVQHPGTDRSADYDGTVYYLRVSVVWENGELKARAAVHTQPDLHDPKVEEVAFRNFYPSRETPILPLPGEFPALPTPSTPPLKVIRTEGSGTPVEESPAEKPVPQEPLRTEEGPLLIQTGQWNWPIPVLAGGGLGLIALGRVLRHRRKREEDA